jgi:hypothetical protein
MISRDLATGRPDLAYLYLVFDPGRGNHRDAEQIHGFSDSALRLQDPFAVHAADIWRFLTSAPEPSLGDPTELTHDALTPGRPVHRRRF